MVAWYGCMVAWYMVHGCGTWLLIVFVLAVPEVEQ